MCEMPAVLIESVYLFLAIYCYFVYFNKWKFHNHVYSNSDEKTKDNSSKEEKPHKCHLCNDSFSKTNHLKSHMSMVHDDRRPFQCTQCDSSFKVKHHLKRHVERSGNFSYGVFKWGICIRLIL